MKSDFQPKLSTGKIKDQEDLLENGNVLVSEVSDSHDLSNSCPKPISGLQEFMAPEVMEPEVSLNNVFSVENTTSTPRHGKKRLEVSFEYKGQTTIFSLETDGTEQQGKEILEIQDTSELISLQKQCPDFKDIYSYLTGFDLPKDENLNCMVTIEKESYDLLDAILILR